MTIAVKERPIIFSGPSIPAILNGPKTQTRRAMKPQPVGSPILNAAGNWRLADRDGIDPNSDTWRCPYGQPGERLWVKETFWERENKAVIAYDTGGGYRDNPSDQAERMPMEWDRLEKLQESESPKRVAELMKAWGWNKCPSFHMPRWASRITLEVTDVRVERVQAISAEDVSAEGIEQYAWSSSEEYRFQVCKWRDCVEALHRLRRDKFTELWDSINAKRGYSWESNPWVWVVGFRLIS